MAAWADVTANPEYQKLTPDQKEAARKQYFDQTVAPKVPKDQLEKVRQQFDAQTLPKGNESVGPVLDRVLASVPDVALQATGLPQMETALHYASGMAALPVEAAGSVYGALTAPPGLKAKTAAENVQKIGEAMTYQPHSPGGKAATETLDKVAGVIPKAAEKFTGDIAEDPQVKSIFGNTGSEVVQGLANTAWQALPTLLGVRGGKAAITRTAEAGAGEAGGATAATRAAANAAAVAKAREFVEQKAGMKWDEVSADVKDKLTLVAKFAPEQLDKIKPTSVARESRLQQLKIPGTRGDIERDVAQMTHEQTLSKSETGKPIRDIKSEQDVRLHRLVDVAKRTSGAKAATRESVGKSVETALRGKAEENPEKWGRAQTEKGLKSSAKAVWSKANYNRLYDIARATEPNASVSAEPIVDLLKKNPDIQKLGWLQTWLKKAKVEQEAEEPGPRLVDTSGKPLGEEPPETELRELKLDELAQLRQDAADIARTGQGAEKLYAGKVVGAVDDAMENVPAAAKAWKAAINAFKQHKIEFEDQSLVEKLTGMKSRTDPKTALADTGDAVRAASSDQIRGLKKTLTEGGTEKTRTAGKQAWKDIQGSVLDYLREKADKNEETGAEGQRQFNKGFRDALRELDKDGKLEAIFDPKQVKFLRKIAQATEDVRTMPRTRIQGSDTAANIQAATDRAQVKALTALEKTSRIPKVGPYLAGGAKVLRSMKEKGQAVKDVATAQRSRLQEAAADTQTRSVQKRYAKEAKARAKADAKTPVGKKRAQMRRRNTMKSLADVASTAGAFHRATLKDDEDRKKKRAASDH